MKSVEITEDNIKSFDIVVLATDHDDFDYSLIEEKVELIVHTRNCFQNTEKIIKA